VFRRVKNPAQRIETFLPKVGFLRPLPAFEVTLIPFRQSATEHFAVIGFELGAAKPSLERLWSLTSQLASELKRRGCLDGLKGLEVIIGVGDERRDMTRILKFGVTFEAIERAALMEPLELLNPGDGATVFCHWYVPTAQFKPSASAREDTVEKPR
jgi:hypothetical protein